jgi:bacterial/archaeal transporter family protein
MVKSMVDSWVFWALLSALFAALTAIFGKVGVTGVDPDYATLLRVVVIAVFAGVLVYARGVAQPLTSLSPRTLIFLGLSGLATGVSWLCYYRALSLGQAAQVAPIDKLSIVLVAILGVTFLGEHLSPRNWLGVAFVAGGAVLIGWKA